MAKEAKSSVIRHSPEWLGVSEKVYASGESRALCQRELTLDEQQILKGDLPQTVGGIDRESERQERVVKKHEGGTQ